MIFYLNFLFINIPVIICLCFTTPCNLHNVLALLFKWFPNFIWFIHWIIETIVSIMSVLGYSSSSWSTLWILSWQQFVIMNNVIGMVIWYPLIVSKCWLDGWICLHCTRHMTIILMPSNWRIACEVAKLMFVCFFSPTIWVILSGEIPISLLCLNTTPVLSPETCKCNRKLCMHLNFGMQYYGNILHSPDEKKPTLFSELSTLINFNWIISLIQQTQHTLFGNFW